MERVSYSDILKNAKIKVYPDGSASLLVLDRCVIRESGWEADKPDSGGSRWEDLSEDEREARNLSRSQRRARSAVFDLALSTPFSLFVTFTLDARRVDRYDHEEVLRHLRYWLDNSVRRRGLVYVLVPELHKDGALHFHGLINEAIDLTDSGTIIPPEGGKPRRPRSAAQRESWLTNGGKIVYNLPRWTLGFSTAIRLYGDRRRAVGYVCKYITKADAKIGGRWYYSGGDLKHPDGFTADLDFSKAAAVGEPFTVDELGCKAVKIWSDDLGKALEEFG